MHSSRRRLTVLRRFDVLVDADRVVRRLYLPQALVTRPVGDPRECVLLLPEPDEVDAAPSAGLLVQGPNRYRSWSAPLPKAACNDVVRRVSPAFHLVSAVHQKILRPPDVGQSPPEPRHRFYPFPTIPKRLVNDDEEIHVRCIVGVPSGLGPEQHDPDGIHLVHDRVDHSPQAIAESMVQSKSHNAA